jgi:4-amino-4-deoxy-L-arabinose transferase-like glycosyltransferase
MLSSPEVAATGEEEAPAKPVRRQQIDVERIAWLAVLILAALTRLPALGALPLSLADSSRAFAAWQVAQGRLPAGFWSGDLAQTLTAGVFKVAGAGDGRARLIAALLGVGLVAVLWYYRALIGRAAALFAAFFLALSPVCVAVSRSLSPYAAGALFAAAAGAALLSFIDRPRPAPLAWLAGLLGLGMSTDASFLLFVLAGVLFCLVEGLWIRRAGFIPAGIYLREHPQLIRSSLLIGLAGLLVAVTRFGIATDRLRSGAALSWSQAFSAGPNALPWHYPLAVLLAYEPFLLIGGILTGVYLIAEGRRLAISIAERLLLYWAIAALAFVLLAQSREPGQLSLLVVPLALLTGIGCARALALARWDLLRAALAPSLLAIPALVYVLFVLESTTIQAPLALGQQLSLTFLFFGGVGLLILGAIWSRRAAPAYLALCGLVFGIVFALHTTSRVGFNAGDEFLLGPVATADAPALAQVLSENAPLLHGVISIAPQFSTPLDWYTRGNSQVRDQGPVPASAIDIQSVNLTGPPGFAALIPNSEIARAWYPSSIDPGGMLKWLLYRQAWQRVATTSVQALVRSGQP